MVKLSGQASQRCDDLVVKFLNRSCTRGFRLPTQNVTYDALESLSLKLNEIVEQADLVALLVAEGMPPQVAKTNVATFAANPARNKSASSEERDSIVRGRDYTRFNRSFSAQTTNSLVSSRRSSNNYNSFSRTFSHTITLPPRGHSPNLSPNRSPHRSPIGVQKFFPVSPNQQLPRVAENKHSVVQDFSTTPSTTRLNSHGLILHRRDSTREEDYVYVHAFCQEYKRLMRMAVLRSLQVRCHEKHSSIIKYKRCKRVMYKFLGPKHGAVNMMDVFGVNHVFLGLMGGNGQDVKTPTITLSHLARWYFTGEVVQEKEAEEERNVAKQTKAPRGNIRTTNPITANKPVSQVHTRKQVQDLEHIFNELSNHSECCTMAAIQRRCGPSGESIYLTKSLVSADPEIVTLPEWLHFFRTNRAFQNDRFALDAFISDVLVSVEETKQPTTMAIQIMAPAEVPVHDQYDLAGVNKPQSRKQHASHASKSSMDVSGRLSISIQEHETPPLKIEPRLIVYGKIPSDKEFDMTVHEVRVLSPVAQREVDSENSPTYAH